MFKIKYQFFTDLCPNPFSKLKWTTFTQSVKKTTAVSDISTYLYIVHTLFPQKILSNLKVIFQQLCFGIFREIYLPDLNNVFRHHATKRHVWDLLPRVYGVGHCVGAGPAAEPRVCSRLSLCHGHHVRPRHRAISIPMFLGCRTISTRKGICQVIYINKGFINHIILSYLLWRQVQTMLLFSYNFDIQSGSIRADFYT